MKTPLAAIASALALVVFVGAFALWSARAKDARTGDLVFSREVVAYETLPASDGGEAVVRYEYAGEPLPEKIVPDEVVKLRTESSYTRILDSAPDPVTKERTYQAVFYMEPVFVKREGEWYYRETATTTESAFYRAKPARLFAKMLSASIAYAASYSGFSTSGDGYVSVSGEGDGLNPDIAALSDCNTSNPVTPVASVTGTTPGQIAAVFSAAGFGSCTRSIGFFPFDTSSIPASATVSAATLSVYVTSKTNAVTNQDDVRMVLAPSDVESFDSYGGTAGATSINMGSITTSAYNDWVFNATGLTWITEGGTTYLGLREQHEINGSIASGLGNSVTFSTSEQTNTTQDPTLSVTYTAPPSGAFWMFQDF